MIEFWVVPRFRFAIRRRHLQACGRDLFAHGQIKWIVEVSAWSKGGTEAPYRIPQSDIKRGSARSSVLVREQLFSYGGGKQLCCLTLVGGDLLRLGLGALRRCPEMLKQNRHRHLPISL